MPYAKHHRKEKQRENYKKNYKPKYGNIIDRKYDWNKGKNNPNYRGTDVTYNCEACGKEKKVILSQYKKGKHHFCSKKCLAIWKKTQIGNNAPNWQGGLRDTNRRIRSSLEYKRWRIGVLIRDNFTCQTCKIVGTSIEVHHIKSFAKNKELRLDINNGISLCINCHKEVDEYRKRFRR